MVLHAMIPFFMDYFSLMEFVLFLFYCFRQLWWPISVPALSNGFFQFLRSHWYSQPSSTQPKSRWVGWLNLQSKVLNKHTVGKWKKVQLTHWNHDQEQCLEERWEEGDTIGRYFVSQHKMDIQIMLILFPQPILFLLDYHERLERK